MYLIITIYCFSYIDMDFYWNFDVFHNPRWQGCLDSLERGTVEWNNGMVEWWNSGMVERWVERLI